MGENNLEKDRIADGQEEQKLNFKPATKTSKRLVSKAQEGDEDAVNRLIELYYRDMLYFAIKQVGREDGQDVTQKAIEHSIGKLNDLRDQTKFKSWMMRAVYRECIDFIRKKKRQGNQVKVVELHDESQIEMVENRSQVFDQPFASDIENDKLLAIFDDMPERFSTCIRLRYLEDMNYTEIAEVLDINETKVKNDLHRGMKLLKQRIEEQGGASSFLAVGPTAAIPALTQMLQADQGSLVAPHMVEQGLALAKQSLAVQQGAAAASSVVVSNSAVVSKMALGIKIGLGGAAATAVATTGIVFALNQTPEEPEIVVPEAVEIEPTPVAEPATPEEQQEQPITTIADMIGEELAAQLEGFEANGADAAQWEAFLTQIGAEPDMVSSDSSYQYSAYLLTKQDKQLVLADKQDINREGSLKIRSSFGPSEDSLSQMAVVFMFE